MKQFISKVVAFAKRAPEIAKALVAALSGLLAISAALSDQLGVHVIPAGWSPAIAGILVVLGAVATYHVPNAAPASQQ